DALASIHHQLRPKIVPLVEIVQRRPKPKKKGRKKKLGLRRSESDVPTSPALELPTPQEHLLSSFRLLNRSLLGYSRCLIDTRELAADEALRPQAVFAHAATMGISFTPVTGLGRTFDIDAALGYG